MGSIGNVVSVKKIKATRKPGDPISLHEYQPGGELPPNVTVRKDGSAFVFNPTHKSEINIQPGDFVRVDDPNDTYPITKDYFEKNFEEVQ